MSKGESIARYHIIISKLRKHTVSFHEIEKSLKSESNIQGYNFNISKRTFQRDLKDIFKHYGIVIIYDRTKKGYKIKQEGVLINERILEAYDTFSALSLSHRLEEYIHFEKRSSLGTENLFGLMHAIKNKVQICFSYKSYQNNKLSKRLVEPYALKEYKGRWYLVCIDCKDHEIKSFAIDRLSDLDISKVPFKHYEPNKINNYYKHSFGIVGPNLNADPEEVILKFTPHQGKYIKSFPLHSSQVILEDDEFSVTVKLKIHITQDFIMEVLRHGTELVVVSPSSLVREIKQLYTEALEQYN
jgi:hypothetical protein